MSFPTIRVPPDPKYSAEVLVLLTTLGAKRSEFNAGKRARDLLEIKRVHHKIVDFNRDARQAGTGEAENQAIQKLNMQGKLQTGDNDDLILPQIFIDGHYIGDANALQGLEDDRMLDDILLRRACMKCNDTRRVPDSKQCVSCEEKFEEILPGLMTIEQVLRELAMVAEGDYEDDYDGDYAGEPADSNQAPLGGYLPASKSTLDETFRIHGGGVAEPAAGPAPAVPVVVVSTKTAIPAAGPAPAVPAAVISTKTAIPAVATPAASGIFKKGDQVQYWSDTKNRWVDACVEAKHEKDGVIKYDLNCKRGATADKVRRPGSG